MSCAHDCVDQLQTKDQTISLIKIKSSAFLPNQWSLSRKQDWPIISCWKGFSKLGGVIVFPRTYIQWSDLKMLFCLWTSERAHELFLSSIGNNWIFWQFSSQLTTDHLQHCSRYFKLYITIVFIALAWWLIVHLKRIFVCCLK